MTAPRAFVVVGLGFGDEGKGTITDHLVRESDAELVVRFNGGAQAGHNVVLADGRHHTFAQLGAGTFAGARTHLAGTVVVHPSALLVEARVLGAKGVADPLSRVSVAPDCRVTTPFHQAAGRLRELARGDGAHGTCGVGVGETVRDGLDHPPLRAAELTGPDGPLLERLDAIRERLLASLPELGGSDAEAEERVLLTDPSVGARWLELIADFRRRVRLVNDGAVGAGLRSAVVFEGAQGVLLDEHVGFHPHTTWSTCTSAWAEDWLEAHAPEHRAVRVGVSRTTLTRHGQGPLPSFDETLGAALLEPHNGAEGWQGRFRIGWLDLPLLRYAIAANGGLDALAITHLDRVGAALPWRVVRAHPEPPAATPGDLDSLAALTERLFATRPEAEPLGPAGCSDIAAWLEEQLPVPVALTSSGPTANDKRWRAAI